MKLWPRRKPTPEPARPRANHTRIAVLEHDLLGIKPEPGSMAALTIAMRRTATCLEHQPIETTTFSDPYTTAMCAGCGGVMVQGDDGAWQLAGA